MTDTIAAGVQYEVACETITHLVALRVEQMEIERGRAAPDTAKLDDLQAEIERLSRERRSLSSQDPAAIAELIGRYAPIVREGLRNPPQ